MLIVLSLFFLLVWLVFFKFAWLPWTRGWKITVYSGAIAIALVVVGALQYYTPVSKKAVVATYAQFIYPLVSGDIEEVYVQGSRNVSAGEALFRIDPRPYLYAVDNWEAATTLAKLALVDAERLVKSNAIARFALDEKRAQYKQAVAQLAQARYQLENTEVKAPADGFIAINPLRIGQRVNMQTPALTFLETSDMWISAVFKQNGLALIKPGSKATVIFSARPGEIYHTEVEIEIQGLIQGQITIESAAAPINAITNAQDAYPVRIAFPADAPASLRQAGKLAEVTIFTSPGNPINVLAKILQWINSWMKFIL